MKKTTGVLASLVIAIAAVGAAGAWYTGKQLPAELERSVAVTNQQIRQALIGAGGSMSLELVSLDQHWFSSTAHYRLRASDVRFGAMPLSFEASIDDTIEHGPFPWSRVKVLKLLPVMAASNPRLQSGDDTAAWFAAAGGASPLQGHFSLGYDGSVQGKVRLLPLKLHNADGSSLDFSGLELSGSSDRDRQHLLLDATAGKLDMTVVGEDHPPVQMQFKGFSATGDLAHAGHAMIYAGAFRAALAEGRFILGPEQDQVVVLKGLEGNSLSKASGDKMDGRVQYKVADISINERAVGSGEMVFSMKRYDIPALQSLAEWYASRLPQIQAAQAAGEPLPSVDMSEQERAKVHADLAQLLSAKPQVALENLSFKTANGESRFSVSVDFASPGANVFALPADQLSKQLISQLKLKLSLSKPMIGDLATLQALLQGDGDLRAIARQSSQAGEMVGLMAVQSGLATVQGDDVLTTVDYADGMVDFNGRKMTLEAFVTMLDALVQAAGGYRG